MVIHIEFIDGLYYWTVKDNNGMTNNWSTSIGNAFEDIIRDRVKHETTREVDTVTVE